jgi:hypothetical protein
VETKIMVARGWIAGAAAGPGRERQELSSHGR